MVPQSNKECFSKKRKDEEKMPHRKSDRQTPECSVWLRLLKTSRVKKKVLSLGPVNTHSHSLTQTNLTSLATAVMSRHNHNDHRRQSSQFSGIIRAEELVVVVMVVASQSLTSHSSRLSGLLWCVRLYFSLPSSSVWRVERVEERRDEDDAGRDDGDGDDDDKASIVIEEEKLKSGKRAT